MLDLMKQRIEEANRPKAKSPEMESSERERDQTKSALSQKQAELTKQQETANSVQQQQQPVESEVQQEQVFTDMIVCKQEISFKGCETISQVKKNSHTRNCKQFRKSRQYFKCRKKTSKKAYAYYCEVAQIKEQKENELAQLNSLINAQEKDDDSMTNRIVVIQFTGDIMIFDV